MRRIVVGQPVVDWVAQKTDAEFGLATGFGVERDGQLVAGVVFCAYNKASMFIHVASDGSRQWVSKELLKVVFDYAFRQAGVKVLIGTVPESNTDAQRFDEHVGFVRTSTIPDAHPDGDLYIYTMTREQCRWVKHE